MPVDTEVPPVTKHHIKAPRGTQLSCKGWQQEAAMRMLMNNLDDEVAERPKDLVVYGGTGRAARNAMTQSSGRYALSSPTKRCSCNRVSLSVSSRLTTMLPAC